MALHQAGEHPIRAFTALAIAALVAGGCVGAAGSPNPPSAAASVAAPSTALETPAPAVAATSSQSPVAAPTSSSPAPQPPARLARSAVVERDGVRLRVELQRNPMTAGDVTRVTATVRNLTDRPLRWLSDGCEIPVSVEGLSPMAWPKGETHRPQAQLFKDLALGRLFRTPPLPGPIADFVDPGELGRGSFGCGDIGIDHTIEPHATVESVQAWDGAAALRWGPFPSGPVTITASFAHFWRGATMPDVGTSAPLTATLDGWVIDGPGAGWLGPVGAVDAALRDPGFVTWLDGQDLRSGRDEIAWYRPALGLWEVGVLAWYDAPTPQMHLLHVDPYTGEVLATIDRQWDQRLDGFP